MKPDLSIAPLLLDALQHTTVNPTSSHHWHALLSQCDGLCDLAAQRFVEQYLLAHVPRTGIEGFLMTTFLAHLTNDLAYIEEAGKIVQHIRPFDMDRLAAFAVYEWGRIVARGGDRSDFIAGMCRCHLPEIMQLQGQHVAANSSGIVKPRVITQIGKIALVVSYLSNAEHTPTALAFQHARLLVSLGFEVQVFSSQELRLPHMPHYLGNKGDLLTPAPDAAVLQKIIPEGVTATFSDERFSLLYRAREIIEKIAEFDPDLVFFIGLNSVLMTTLYQSRPVLGLCVHAVAPMAPVDVWLAATPSLAKQRSQVWGTAIPAALASYHPYRISLKPVHTVLAREDLNVTADQILLVSVGSRLGTEISGDWAARMAGLVQQHPAAVWVLVGGGGVLPPALAQLPAEKIRLLPHHADVRSVYRCCDVYVNPPRLGGGFSVAEAMAESLPIVAFADSDGGNKLGDYAVETITGYVDLLGALLDSAALRQQNGTLMRALFSATLDIERSAGSLLAACYATLACYHQRAGVDNSGQQKK
jgi:glycosyltransferase involved in cell wall biosynthesis